MSPDLLPNLNFKSLALLEEEISLFSPEKPNEETDQKTNETAQETLQSNSPPKPLVNFKFLALFEEISSFSLEKPNKELEIKQNAFKKKEDYSEEEIFKEYCLGNLKKEEALDLLPCSTEMSYEELMKMDQRINEAAEKASNEFTFQKKNIQDLLKLRIQKMVNNKLFSSVYGIGMVRLGYAGSGNFHRFCDYFNTLSGNSPWTKAEAAEAHAQESDRSIQKDSEMAQKIVEKAATEKPINEEKFGSFHTVARLCKAAIEVFTESEEGHLHFVLDEFIPSVTEEERAKEKEISKEGVASITASELRKLFKFLRENPKYRDKVTFWQNNKIVDAPWIDENGKMKEDWKTYSKKNKEKRLD